MCQRHSHRVHVQMIRYLLLTIMLLSSGLSVAEINITPIHPKVCKQGVHEQPNGLFAIYVFCDDALGTNIAVFLNKMRAPVVQNYNLGNRFWQNQEWSLDVISFAWLPDNMILLSTSAINGTGSVYLLNPAQKVARVLVNIEGAVIELLSVEGDKISIRYETAPGKYKYRTINM